MPLAIVALHGGDFSTPGEKVWGRRNNVNANEQENDHPPPKLPLALILLTLPSSCSCAVKPVNRLPSPIREEVGELYRRTLLKVQNSSEAW